jgi:hypothetical protein
MILSLLEEGSLNTEHAFRLSFHTFVVLTVNNPFIFHPLLTALSYYINIHVSLLDHHQCFCSICHIWLNLITAL